MHALNVCFYLSAGSIAVKYCHELGPKQLHARLCVSECFDHTRVYLQRSFYPRLSFRCSFCCRLVLPWHYYKTITSIVRKRPSCQKQSGAEERKRPREEESLDAIALIADKLEGGGEKQTVVDGLKIPRAIKDFVLPFYPNFWFGKASEWSSALNGLPLLNLPSLGGRAQALGCSCSPVL